MDPWMIRRAVDMNDAIMSAEYIGILAYTGSAAAHRIELKVTRGGLPVSWSGARVRAYFLAGEPPQMLKSVDAQQLDNVVQVDFPKEAYLNARSSVVLMAEQQEAKIPLYAAAYTVRSKDADTILTDEYIIYDVSTLLDKIDEMNQASESANTAAGSAQTAAESANSAASSAQTAAGLANAAAGSAQAAATAIEGMRADAQELEAGADPTVTVERGEGTLLLHFGIPAGVPGAVPRITFEVATGAPGTQVQVEQSGTPEAPVVRLTIPRGDTGAVDSLPFGTQSPAALGEASAGTADTIARSDHVHPMPSAADVGALPSTYKAPVTSVNGATGSVNVSMIKTNNGYATLYYNANAGCYLVSVDQTSDSSERKSGFYVDFVTKKSVAYYQEDNNPKYDVIYTQTNNPPKIGVNGAKEGHVPLFNASGDLVSSGKSFWDFTRAKMTLSGTTLTITTVN